jgi:hypothetical protein
VRFEVFTAVNNQVEVFWVVTSCTVVKGDTCFGGFCFQGEVTGEREKKGQIDMPGVQEGRGVLATSATNSRRGRG